MKIDIDKVRIPQESVRFAQTNSADLENHVFFQSSFAGVHDGTVARVTKKP
jgi:hypothetical protein